MIFRGFRNLSKLRRFRANIIFILSLKGNLKNIFEIFALRSRGRSHQTLMYFYGKWFFWKNIASILSKFCVVIASYVAHNRLDFEKNRTASSYKNSEKTKKRPENAKYGKFKNKYMAHIDHRRGRVLSHIKMLWYLILKKVKNKAVFY